ncbi:MAG: TetR/AcrR family transcriptional regulator [Polyangia bacterium]
MKRKPTEVRQAEIVEAAMRIIVAKGARRFTAQLIADEVGMTAGGIFRHFSSMDEIVDAVLDRMEEVLFQGFPPSAEDPWDRLKEFFEHRVQVMVEHPDISRILLSDHLAHLGDGKPASRVERLKRRSRRFVTRCLQEAAASGAMASDVSVNAATVMVLGAILAVGHSTTRVADETETKQLTAEVWRALEKMRHVSGTNSQR